MTQPNPTQPNPTQSNPTQPNPWIDQTHVQLCGSDDDVYDDDLLLLLVVSLAVQLANFIQFYSYFKLGWVHKSGLFRTVAVRRSRNFTDQMPFRECELTYF